MPARFILMNIDGHDVKNKLPDVLKLEDEWIVSDFNGVGQSGYGKSGKI